MNNVDRVPLSHEQVLESLPAYVLGTLDPDEMLAVDDYLQAHPELMRRVEELEAVTAQLAYAAPPAPLPKAALGQVMQRARASLPPTPQPTQVRRTQPTRRATESWTDRVAAWWQQRGLFDVTLAGTALVTLLLVVALGRTFLQLENMQGHIFDLQTQVAALQSNNDLLRDENVRLQGELESRQNQLASVAGATDLVALAGTDAAPLATGALYVRGSEATLVLTNLDDLGADQIYQLWLIPAEGAPIPAGLLGSGEPVQTVSLALPANVDGFAAIGVSIEPRGGSPAPTGPIVLAGPIT